MEQDAAKDPAWNTSSMSDFSLKPRQRTVTWQISSGHVCQFLTSTWLYPVHKELVSVIH
ncbi:unnamed protein product [Acanthoscelides obtectus]|uniref:Uncharacterized protein n=1 Tax=Acanthoscelides obtectus TaxID=200917 RepID=A0A9P0PKW3_ACAOB|nr:unnamed protein product [Acanthoscelides obtectus]CAK1677744.1 hypothetical protein AOBTE_LOCUS31529 [Acanthoscelides obtectus]